MRRLLSLLLRLYSADFQERFGADAVRDAAYDVHTARARGGITGLVRAAVVLLGFGASGVLDRGASLTRIDRDGLHDWAGGWGLDTRLALRHSLRRPGFVLVAVLSLVIGVGANAIVFTLADTLMMRDVPGADRPDRIVEVSMRAPDGDATGWSWPDFLSVREELGALEHVAMYDPSTLSVSDAGTGARLLGMHVTSGYFDVFGVDMQLGRAFTAEEDGPGLHHVAVLSHDAWLTRFEADPGVLGRTLRLNRETYTIVGVVAEGFRGHHFSVQPAVYLPLRQHDDARRTPDLFFEHRGTRWAAVIGRLADGASEAGANAALATLAARLSDGFPESNGGWSMRASRARLAPVEARTQLAIAFALLAVLVLLVLATACANVGGMLLARASEQEHDLAVRQALGAGRRRLVRLLLLEAMVVFVLGGAGGVLLALRGIEAFDVNAMIPTPFPVHFDLILDWRLLGFGLVLTLGTGVVFGLLPALRITRTELSLALREQGGTTGLRASRLRRLFIAGQVSVSIMLLATATLVLRTTQANVSREPAFDPLGVWVTRLEIDQEGYRDPAEGAAFVHGLLEHLRAQPGVTAAMAATSAPLDGRSSSGPVWPDGRSANEAGWIQADYMKVSDGFFETLGIEPLTGRTFGTDDRRETGRVAVVNSTLAAEAWPGEDPLGRVVSYGLDSLEYTVVGVVADTRTDLVTDPLKPQLYTLLAQDWAPRIGIFVRAASDEPGFAERVRAAMLEVDGALALGTSRPLAELADLGVLPFRIVGRISTALGALALFLAAIGVYGLVAYMVTRRTREIGVRIALGSSRARVMGGVLGSGLMLALPGFVIGTVLAVGLAQALGSVIYGLDALDPVAYASVAFALAGVVLAAGFAPARRASAVQPMDALRSD